MHATHTYVFICLIDSMGSAVRSKQLKSSPSKESTQIPLLNANAAAVLSELGLSEDGHPPPKSSVRAKRPPSLGTQQNAPRVFNPGKTTLWYTLLYMHFLNRASTIDF